jgi:hypothetical protein
MLVGVLLFSLPMVSVVVNCYFNFHSPDFQQLACDYSPHRLYRNYKWRQLDKADRVNHRKTVGARVLAAGGWAALQRDCEALVQTNRDGDFMWDKWNGDTNALPPSMAALQPMEVLYYSPSALRSFYLKTNFSVVRIKMFGEYRTGLREIPFLGLEVVCGTNADSYTPQHVDGVRYDNCEKVTNSIYEVY